MNKKILAILCVFAIAMVGCAYATDSSDSLNNNTVTISGVNFTIPEGFTEDVDEAVVNESNSEDGHVYITNSKTFESDDSILVMSVSEYEQNITDDLINDLGDETTINNVTGYLNDLGFLSLFSYVQDGKLAVIGSDDENIIEDVLS